jgi:ubiquinol-cytochrome c reductase iron-sulfur subunit
MANTTTTSPEHEDEGKTRRDFLLVATATVGAVGAALAVWPFIHMMNPAADTLALATTGVDLSPIEEGQRITVVWRGKPVFIDHRTEADIAAARETSLGALIDPQPDEERVQRPEWLIVVGICTHLGCIPLGQRSGEARGEFGGWFCPCHGSHYDTSGRIRRGPAPTNLVVPPYEFVDDTTIRIG